MKEKLTSRKFWICMAAFLGSLATGITASFSGNETITGIGLGCGILSAAIYAATEASVDKARINADISYTVHNVEAKSDDMMTVAAVLVPAVTEDSSFEGNEQND